MSYIETERATRNTKAEGDGEKWLHQFLDTLSYGFQRTLKQKQEAQDKDNALLDKARGCFALLSASSEHDGEDTMSKEELVAAQGGVDFHMFDEIDGSHDGTVSKEEIHPPLYTNPCMDCTCSC